ncbi:MAG: hypothetical protein R3282_00040, partial [Rhodothermales bacterium]|nr:hypothetical protein [Rhodothermales bacterium]
MTTKKQLAQSGNLLVGCLLGSILASLTSPASAVPGETITTPSVIPELPIEVETEVSPAGSLKMIPLWKETRELLEDPHAYTCPPDDATTIQFDESSECEATTERRPSFTPMGCTDLPAGSLIPEPPPCDELPPLRVFNACFNVLTGQPLRFRPDEEIDWNQPGPLFDPDEVVPVEPIGPPLFIESNIPAALRTIIGYLVVDGENNLVVANPGPEVGDPGVPDPRIPPDGTIIAEPACNEVGQLVEDGVVVEELEQPVNETHFFRGAVDTRGLKRELRDLYLGFEGKPNGNGNGKGSGKPKKNTPPAEADSSGSTGGRLWAEILGKSFFWDMQVGSDVVQACGSCHFHAGADNRTRNQLNPNTMGGDMTLQVKGPNEDVVASDFPFHEKVNPDLAAGGEDTNCGTGALPACTGNVLRDANDVMSSMGVSEFKQFVDVVVGAAAFGPADGHGVRSLVPDTGISQPDPLPAQI